jgi:hypothetical protein
MADANELDPRLVARLMERYTHFDACRAAAQERAMDEYRAFARALS